MTIVQTQCCELFILIKNELMFLQRVVRVVATRVLGKIEKLCTIENYKLKGYVQIEKIKNKKKLSTMEKVKTKKLKRKLCTITNESLRVPGVIDQCSRVDRRCD